MRTRDVRLGGDRASPACLAWPASGATPTPTKSVMERSHPVAQPQTLPWKLDTLSAGSWLPYPCFGLQI